MLLRFSDIFPLKRGRAHEVTGPSAPVFAGISVGLSRMPAFWFVEDWMHETLNPMGLIPYCDPHRILIGKCPTPTDVLAATGRGFSARSVSPIVAMLGR